MSRPPKKDTRPKIWAEGHQHPPFQPRAFARASVIFARDSLSGLLDRCAGSADGFGQTVATGRWRVPENRLGRTGRYLPSVATTAATIHGTAEVLRRTARVVLPLAVIAPMTSIFDERPPVEKVRPVHPARLAPAQKTAAPPNMPKTQAPLPPGEDTDLAAIRAMMQAMPEPAPEPAPEPEPEPEPAPARAPTSPARGQTPQPEAAKPSAAAQHAAGETDGWRREWLKNGAATGLGYGLLAMAMPVGITRALIAHLAGEDLREMQGDA